MWGNTSKSSCSKRQSSFSFFTEWPSKADPFWRPLMRWSSRHSLKHNKGSSTIWMQEENFPGSLVIRIIHAIQFCSLFLDCFWVLELELQHMNDKILPTKMPSNRNVRVLWHLFYLSNALHIWISMHHMTSSNHVPLGCIWHQLSCRSPQNKVYSSNGGANPGGNFGPRAWAAESYHSHLLWYDAVRVQLQWE